MKKIFFRLYNSLIKNPATSQTALISTRDLNMWKALKDKQWRDFMLNRSQDKILITPSNMAKVDIFYLPAPTKTLEQIKVSGLKDLPIEYLNSSYLFKEIYKKGFFISMSKLLYILGRYEIHNDEALVKNIDKFFLSIVPVLHNIQDYKLFRDVYLSKYMGNMQHLLVSFFKKKKFNIAHCKQYLLNNVDFNMFKYCTILNLIESHVLNMTLHTLFSYYSFVAINPDSNLLDERASIFDYDREISELKTGQMHVDCLGVRAICDQKGNIELILCYKDVKMYESGAIKGRITLKPELIYNERCLREYLSKNITTLQKIVHEKKLGEEHPCYELLEKLNVQKKEIYKAISMLKKNRIADYIQTEDIKIVQKELTTFNNIILKSMKDVEIADIVNLGLSEDPGRNEEFIMFYEKHLKEQVEDFVRNMNEEEFSKLHTSKINSENEVVLYKTQRELTELFPERLDNGFEIKENIYKSLEYVASN